MKKINSLTVSIALLCWHSASYAAGFDCTKASSYVEKTICSTPELSSLDDQVSALYRQAIQTHPADLSSIRKAQLSWLKEVRNASTSAEALQHAYTSRIAALNALLNGSSAPVTTTQQSQPAIQPVQPVQPVQQQTASGPSAQAQLNDTATSQADRYCQAMINYSKDAEARYITNHQTQPRRLRVTDNGNAFVIHFDHYYGLGDMNSGLLTTLGTEITASHQESDGSLSVYKKNEVNGTASYNLASVSTNSKKPRFDAMLYDCQRQAPQ